MYGVLKKLAYRFLPGESVTANKERLRRGAAQFYRGRAHRCNVCGFGLRTFVAEPTGLLCPHCGSLGRTRRLYALLERRAQDLRSGRILHFSPPTSLRERIPRLFGPNITYETSDYAGEFDADYRLDLTDTGLADDRYDLIICYHVLEHIPRDRDALQELFRILQPGGVCLIQTPFASENGPSLEDDKVTDPEERLARFGQRDHVRVYSVRDLRGRMEGAGFTVETLSFQEKVENCLGFKRKEFVLVGRKERMLQH